MKHIAFKFKKFAALALSLGVLASLAACGGTAAPAETGSADTADTAGARTIKVAVAPGFYPITYADDDGNAAGYDVAVFQAVDEKLDQYDFTFEIADKETMNVGVQTGTYQVGINSMFKTAERLETYLLPENNMGYTAVGIIYREADGPVEGFQDIYDRQLTIYPTNASGGIKSVFDKWNENHPDAQLSIELLPTLSVADSLAAVQNGEYDVAINLIPVYNLFDDDATAGLAISQPVDVVPTFPIINKEETELNAAVDQALGELKEDGTLSALSQEYFGYDVFSID